MKIIFDLDGTLIDSSERMYRLFQELIPESDFTKEQYWDLKRNKINHKMIIERYFPKYDFDVFNRRWLDGIEDEAYLNTDTLYFDTVSTLEQLKDESVEIILLTARQSKERLFKELERLDIKRYFNVIMTTGGLLSKEELLFRNSELSQNSDKETVLFVSDMGKDILIGKHFGYKTIAITRGFMDEKCLSEYEPDFIIQNLDELLEIMR